MFGPAEILATILHLRVAVIIVVAAVGVLDVLALFVGQAL